MQNTVESPYLILKQAAQYLQMPYGTAKAQWKEWARYGVHAHPMGKRILFKKKELDRMVESRRIN